MNKQKEIYAKLGLSDMMYQSVLEEINVMLDLDQIDTNTLKNIQDILNDTHTTLDMVLDKIAKKT